MDGLELFELFDVFQTQEPAHESKTDGDENEESLFDEVFEELVELGRQKEQEAVTSYLQREERILTLAREKVKRKMGSFKEGSELFSEVKHAKLQEGDCAVISYVRKVITKKVLEPAAEKLVQIVSARNTTEGLETSEPFLRFSELFGPDVELSFQLSHVEAAIIRDVAYSQKRPEKEVAVKVTIDGKSAVVCLNKPLSSKRRGGEFYLRRDVNKQTVLVGDLEYLAPYVLTPVVDKIISQRFGNFSSSEGMEDNMVFWAAKGYLMERLNSCELDGILYAEARFLATYPEISGFIKREMPYKEVSLYCPEEMKTKVRTLDEGYLGLFTPFCKSVPRIRFRSRWDSLQENMYVFLFRMLYRDWHIEENEKVRQEHPEHIARAFETKKNIPEKYLQAMMKSEFNDYFGYVEIDEDCDLNAVLEITEEFKSISRAYFNDLAMKDVALRFRKLGKHRASGLFYPYFNCICVDLRMPESMMHEYFHMLDYNFGELSRTYSFSKVYERYAYLLKKTASELKEDDPAKGILYGNSKYNLDYYLNLSEVFARCGEIYMRHEKGLYNSLSGAVVGIEYPVWDKELMAIIKEYYDKFFETHIYKKEREGKADLAA